MKFLRKKIESEQENNPPLPNKSLNNEIRRREERKIEEEHRVKSMGEFEFILYKIQKILDFNPDMHPEKITAFLMVQNIIYKKKLENKDD